MRRMLCDPPFSSPAGQRHGEGRGRGRRIGVMPCLHAMPCLSQGKAGQARQGKCSCERREAGLPCLSERREEDASLSVCLNRRKKEEESLPLPSRCEEPNACRVCSSITHPVPPGKKMPYGVPSCPQSPAKILSPKRVRVRPHSP